MSPTTISKRQRQTEYGSRYNGMFMLETSWIRNILNQGCTGVKTKTRTESKLLRTTVKDRMVLI